MTVQTGKPEIKEIWDIKTLLKKIPKLGAVIDLTNTSRYYDPRELQAAGILHKKILMPGRIIPPEKKVQEFMDTMDEFLGKDCEFLVGVHCTHGLNRTGYMVCRYMRDRLNILAKDAVKKFEKARGYKIERENYIADLLGTLAPPPDLRNVTELKPIEGVRSYDHRSYCYANASDRQVSTRGKFKRKSKRKQSRSSAEGSDDWGTERCDSGTTSSKKGRRDSDASYDFKYDY
ncbi:mRNA-capping enzyme isoform X2 [Hyposmocoma kahamanoa]|uniref:mRNA-capping enzyme isoform X2 n=1 Tax=Hyposmocoma kahamanoa TaxID=1477025 RepID=UPI000E6D621F|nr:mRNA-capping enzyme isoform X2 [Hyposmocoma kahamanoa]